MAHRHSGRWGYQSESLTGPGLQACLQEPPVEHSADTLCAVGAEAGLGLGLQRARDVRGGGVRREGEREGRQVDGRVGGGGAVGGLAAEGRDVEELGALGPRGKVRVLVQDQAVVGDAGPARRRGQAEEGVAGPVGAEGGPARHVRAAPVLRPHEAAVVELDEQVRQVDAL